jgi:hypothetical protein
MTVVQLKRKYRMHKQAKFGGKCGNPAGQSGSRYKKKHLRAYGAPGTPNGVCAKKESRVKGEVNCRCGGHNV